MRHGEAFMINSNWTDSHQHIKQDALKVKKRSATSTDQDVTDMVFITPDHLTVPKSNGMLSNLTFNQLIMKIYKRYFRDRSIFNVRRRL